MSYPGIIERALYPDEFSIYLDNSIPIPLSALATFLKEIDRSARSVKGMKGRYLQLSDFALGSNELRFRVVGPGRRARDEDDRQDRLVAAAEKSANAAVVSAGAAVVSAVVAMVALAMTTGGANPSTYRITNEYNVQTIYVRGPNEPPHKISRQEIELGRQARSSKSNAVKYALVKSEQETLLAAKDRKEVVSLAGSFRHTNSGEFVFVTMKGSELPAHFDDVNRYKNTPVAIHAIVQDSKDGIVLEVVKVLAELTDL